MSKAYESLWNTPVRNFLLDDLARLEMSGAQANILFKMQRLTYGFEEDSETGRRYDRVTISQKRISEITGLPPRTVENAMSDLVDRQIITVHAAGSGRKPTTFGINSNTDEWVGLRPADTKPGRRSTTKNGGTKSVAPPKKVEQREALVPRKMVEQNIRSTTKNGGTHVLKKDLNKTPLTPQGGRVVDSGEREDRRIGLAMFAMIAQAWYPRTGAPRAFETNCIGLAEEWREHPEALARVFREKLNEQKQHWAAKGERCKYPWTVLNEVSFRMDQIGFKKSPPRPKVPHWVEDDPELSQRPSRARGQPITRPQQQHRQRRVAV